jgi:endothelin-converting enzyme/putative endopeptidase
VGAVLALSACASQEAAKKADPAPVAAPAPVAPAAPQTYFADASKPLPPGLDEGAFDVTVDPCVDLYKYACGGWMAKTEIPADRALYSRGFVEISDRNEKNLKAILDDAAAEKLPAGTPFAKQIGDYYSTCIDEAKLEAALPDVQKFIAGVSQVKNAKDLAKALGTLHQNGMHALFALGSGQDMKDSNQVIAGLDQSGLGLPDRDYYTDDDAKKKAIREAYVAHIAQQLEAAGEKDAARAAELVMAFETRLAKASQTKVERRDPTKLYNRLDRDGLKKQAGAFPWDDYFKAAGLRPDVKAINVNSVSYFKEIAAIAKDTKPETWKAYFTWTVLRGAVPALPKRFQDASFAFASKNFTGAKEDRPRWKKCVAFTDGDLGEAVGREFARRFFPEESKARTSKMIEALQGAVAANLATLSWMDDPTRAAAKVKLDKMVGNNKVGYPNAWRDYTGLKTERTSFFANSLAANRFEHVRDLAKIGRPVDRNEWLMSPPTVNAYYEPQKNEIVFPAGILQPPFFDQTATDAVNFGSMGMVVGHEITHGFDDEGRQFDADGNLKDWWSEKVGKDFVTRADCVKEQFNGYVGVDDIKVKGDLTEGENIADLGGLKLSHAAMIEWYAKKGGDEATKYRYSPSQQFFLGFAQSWCTKVRPEQARTRLATDPHSPPFLRVNGPTGNLDAFRAAFQCSEKSPMVRAGKDQCVVW